MNLPAFTASRMQTLILRNKQTLYGQIPKPPPVPGPSQICFGFLANLPGGETYGQIPKPPIVPGPSQICLFCLANLPGGETYGEIRKQPETRRKQNNNK